MKRATIISIILFFSTFSGYLKGAEEESINSYRKMIDSLYLSKYKQELSEEDAKAIILSYTVDNDYENKLDNDDLKTLSVSYAAIKEPKKAIDYLEQYIKSSSDFETINSTYYNQIKETSEYETVVHKYKPKFSFWFVLYVFTAILGFFVSIILNLKKKTDRIANLLLSVFVFLGALFIIHVCLFISNLQFLIPHSLFISISFNFLYGPLLYFYFRRITDKYVFKFIDVLHLIPALFFLIYFTKYYKLSGADKLHILLNRHETFDLLFNYMIWLKVISLTVYAILVINIYKKTKQNKYGVNCAVIKWQRNLILFNISYLLFYLSYLTMAAGIIPIESVIHLQILPMAILLLYVGYVMYVKPETFMSNIFLNELEIKYKKSGLTESYSNELKDQLLGLLYKDKIFKENDINLEVLSEKLGTTRHSASQVINEHFDMNFFKLINKFRIEEAQNIFRDNFLNSGLTIIDVAYDVGYNNKVTFNKAFKEYTDITPSEYISILKKEKRQIISLI